jgi:hypothetical protein
MSRFPRWGLIARHKRRRWFPESAKLTARDETGAGYFGRYVARSADGNTALIGGFGDGYNTGAAWVFVSPTAGPLSTALTAQDNFVQHSFRLHDQREQAPMF